METTDSGVTAGQANTASKGGGEGHSRAHEGWHFEDLAGKKHPTYRQTKKIIGAAGTKLPAPQIPPAGGGAP